MTSTILQTAQTAEKKSRTKPDREVSLSFEYGGKRGSLRIVLGGRYGADSLAAAQAGVQALQAAALMRALIAAGDSSESNAFRVSTHEADLRRAVEACERLANYAAEEN